MFLRAMILYVAVMAVIRVMGKRQAGQLQPYELVFALVIANIVAAPMADVGVPLVYSIMPVGALMLCYALFSILSLKSQRIRAVITGRPTILVRNGVIDETAMKRQSFSLTELMERVRESGMVNLHEVGCAILEVNGQVSVFAVSQKRTVTPEDLGIATGYEGLPLNLVLDGVVQVQSLKLAGLNEAWLNEKLKKMGAEPKDLYFCALDTSGLLSLQRRGEGRLLLLEALEASKVRW
ncbi:MAG: DUF421 domain-containing protein [Christensenellaceae bacterium]|jgi:uncharacterized membrane protein YcaP (DUF421 family)|nr:DUF421 domain-containing protein [Christensenellaceae bacterium]